MHDGIVVIAEAVATEAMVEVEVKCLVRVDVLEIDCHVLVSVRPDLFVTKTKGMAKFVYYDSFLHEFKQRMVPLGWNENT